MTTEKNGDGLADSFTLAVLPNSSPAIIALLISFIEISLREFRQRLAPVAQFDTQGRAGLVDQNGVRRRHRRARPLVRADRSDGKRRARGQAH